MLFAVKSLYDCGTLLHIKTPFGLLDPIPATVGVKQGCPLSPTLFNLYIDSLYDHVERHRRSGSSSPMVGGRQVPMLLHCDDTALLARSRGDLQFLLDLVDEWCQQHGMTISEVKSEVVVFNCRKPPPTCRIYLRDSCLPVSTFFKYLGIIFHCEKGMLATLPHAARRGRSATAALLRRLHELDVGRNVRTTLSLYMAGPMQAMLYGCEVWGQECLGTTDPAHSGLEVEQVHRNFLRHTLGMRRNTKAWVAFRESGTYPIQHACLARMLRFAESILDLPATDVSHQAFLECAACMHPTGDIRGTWARTLTSLVEHVCPSGTPVSALIDLPHGHVDVDACMCAWRTYYHDCVWGALAMDPRSGPSDGATLCTYHNWFAHDLPANGEHWHMASCLDVLRIPPHHLTSLLRLRTGSHDLAIQRLRQVATGGQRVGRGARVCHCCAPPAEGRPPVQDELHCVLECASLCSARSSYAGLFGAPAALPSMRSLFTQRHTCRALASFVHHHVLPMGGSPAPPNA